MGYKLQISCPTFYIIPLLGKYWYIFTVSITFIWTFNLILVLGEHWTATVKQTSTIHSIKHARFNIGLLRVMLMTSDTVVSPHIDNGAGHNCALSLMSARSVFWLASIYLSAVTVNEIFLLWLHTEALDGHSFSLNVCVMLYCYVTVRRHGNAMSQVVFFAPVHPSVIMRYYCIGTF